MALESASFIDDLVETNPVGGDPITQGDDHLRLLKAVLKGTFPGLDEALLGADGRIKAAFLPEGGEGSDCEQKWCTVDFADFQSDNIRAYSSCLYGITPIVQRAKIRVDISRRTLAGPRQWQFSDTAVSTEI